ncbi:MAG: polyprenyl synthetase family protein [Spirochaetota bacterium]
MEPVRQPGDLALAYLRSRRQLIMTGLSSLVRERGAAPAGWPASLHLGGTELMARLAEYAGRGKMLRGALVYLGAELCTDGDAPSASGIAVAMELFQAGLLVHDDIMDRDELRRGKAAIHASYRDEAASKGAFDAPHLGESLGICAGDICYFEGFGALARSVAGLPLGPGILELCSGELTLVALAQMADCRFGGLPEEPDEEAILAVYRGKTARYSFSLPIACGAMLAGDEATAKGLFAVGELAGLVFQLRDDEIGLFGDPAVTGKGAYSDLRENKKTLMRARLFARADAATRLRLSSIYGSPEAGEAEAAWVRGLVEGLGIAGELRREREELGVQARASVEGIPGLRPVPKETLLDLIDWLSARSS